MDWGVAEPAPSSMADIEASCRTEESRNRVAKLPSEHLAAVKSAWVSWARHLLIE